MPRLPRLDIPGLVYHVIFRGIERKQIFRGEADYKELLGRLSSLAGTEDIKVYGFALMPNHVHLLVRPLKTPLPTFMRRLLTGYAIYFNRKHRRAGHLFQNRYKSFAVEEDTYFLELVRYIHLNPVRAGIVSNLDRLALYPFTGYSALMGRRKYSFMDVDDVLYNFGRNLKGARQGLKEFMVDGIALGRQAHLIGGGLKRSLTKLDLESKRGLQAYDERILGSGLFVEAILKDIDKSEIGAQEDGPLEELLNKVAICYNLSLPELYSGSRRKVVSEARATVVFYATKKLGTPPRVLSEVLGVAPSTIYDIIRLEKGEGGLFQD
ncbi:MAG: hypothetical protein A2074_04290 [Candidatus Aquicultor primus]|uniref:Transposase IS200-like domain-containing protein n=1 Tax=Candidatus Aquicultor primus TaxID=1797195 RepID=A0A1F2UI82_9ACTN|nr:MAG: hypothetical protein A2074_04290 [Candidatus Aquicultor primus]HCG99451.1 transposase [Actinomycetota bacterium]